MAPVNVTLFCNSRKQHSKQCFFEISVATPPHTHTLTSNWQLMLWVTRWWCTHRSKGHGQHGLHLGCFSHLRYIAQHTFFANQLPTSDGPELDVLHPNSHKLGIRIGAKFCMEDPLVVAWSTGHLGACNREVSVWEIVPLDERVRFGEGSTEASLSALPSCQRQTAMECSSSSPMVSSCFPVHEKSTEHTPFVWNPLITDSVCLLAASQTLTSGLAPIWPVAMTFLNLGCSLMARQMMSSVCSK